MSQLVLTAVCRMFVAIAVIMSFCVNNLRVDLESSHITLTLQVSSLIG